MKYKLINKTTGEEHICEKVVIDGFDYYVVDKKDDGGYWTYVGFNEPLELNKSNLPKGWFEKLWDKDNYKTPIATNNPNIDLPKVVDEVEELALKMGEERFAQRLYADNFKEGYNKSQETHPNSDDDMVEFGEWCENLQKDNKEIRRNNPSITRKELLNLWKEQKPKTLYYD